MKSTPFDLSVWQVLTPERDESGNFKRYNAREILAQPSRFFTLENDHVRLFAPVHFAHTEPKYHTATELIEADGPWYYADAHHILKASLSIDEVPSSGIVVIAKVGSEQTPVCPVRIRYRYREAKGVGTVYVSVRDPDGFSLETNPLISNVLLGERISLEVKVTSRGALVVTGAGESGSGSVISSLRNFQDKPMRFRLGCYNVEDLSAHVPGEGSVIRLFEASCMHDLSA